MTGYDFSQFEGRQKHMRYKASIAVNDRDMVFAEIDVVGGIVVQLSLSAMVDGEARELIREVDEEEIKGLVYAIAKFTEMTVTIVSKGGPNGT